MAISSFFLTGTITRRIFSVFFLFALAPICLLSYLAVTRLSEATDQQVSQMLGNETSNLSYLILERLTFAEKLLSINAAIRSSPVPSGETLTTLEHQPGAIPVQLVEARNLGEAFTGEARQQVDHGGTAIVQLPGPDNTVAQLMLQRHGAGQDGPLLAIPLPQNLILGAAEARNLGIESCVLNTDAVLLYATNQTLCANFLSAVGDFPGHKGELVFGADQQHFSRYRTLFMDQNFATPNWIIVVVQPRSDLFLDSINFRKNFIVIALGAVLSLSLISIYYIRTRMAPLATIMAGIERVSAKQYSQPVEVSSGDEFEDLADAFNNMSGQVSRQLDTMASMAEIDQLMLSRQSMENVIRAVLDRAVSVLACQGVGLAVFSNEHDLHGEEKEFFAGRLYVKRDDGSAAPVADEFTISATWSAELKLRPIWLTRSAPGEARQLFDHFSDTVTALYLLPLRREDRLAGALMIGFTQRPDHDDDTWTVANSFADRISVALANAEWEDRLFHQAHYDALTGLPNRLSMQDRLDLSIAQSSRSGKSFAVSFIDLDDFKLVNDALGHMAGDEMIEIIAHRLKACVRAGDIVSRMGGDEFVMISAAFESDESAVMAMSRIAEKLIETIAMPLNVGGREIRASASIGIAIFPRDGENTDTLLKNADSAMYAAKSQGRGCFQFFSEKLNEESVALMNMSSDIKRALERGEFELYYQPKVDLYSGEVVGAEALIRWNHPQRGLVSPGEFIAVAERMGLISRIGNWTLQEACRQVSEWEKAGFTPPRVAVNVSALQIHQDDVPGKVQALLERYGVKPESLELEIVEGVLLENLEATSEKLKAIRKLGVHISIDDYGTGYSSLSYLKYFPVDTLKIDRCFITSLCSDLSDQAIVKSTVVLAHSLALSVIAEGVETAEQVAMLRDLDCDQLQGYFCSKPIVAAQFANFLEGARSLIQPVDEGYERGRSAGL